MKYNKFIDKIGAIVNEKPHSHPDISAVKAAR